MNKQDLISKIKQLEGFTQKERSELINLVNTKKKYGLVWEDKPEDVEEQLRENLPVLKEVKEKAIINGEDSPNHILIEGDNLHALTALTFTHEGKIDVIYIDPPYNTENKDFKYNDTYVDSNDSFRHSKWLSFIEKRLKISKKLLVNNGLLVVSIDDNEIAQLKILLDEIFNQNTKIVTVKMSEASGLKMGAVKKAGIIPKYKEYLVFAKIGGIRELKFDYVPKEQWDDEYNIFLENFNEENKSFIESISEKDQPSDEDIKLIDKILDNITTTTVTAKVREIGLTNQKDIIEWKFKNSYRICRSAASSSVKKLADEKRQHTEQRIFSVVSSRDKLVYIVKGDYDLNSTSPRVQLIFAQDNLTSHPGDFWSDIKTTGLEAEGGVEFKNGKKPMALIKRVINSINKKDSIILDYFAGSGTTLHTTMELNAEDGGNRQCILVTNNENNICEEITYERNKKVIKGYINSRNEQINGLTNNNLRYFKSEFVPSSKTEHNKRLLTQTSTELLCIKEDCYQDITEKEGFNKLLCEVFTNGSGKYLVVVYHSRQINTVCEQLTNYIKGLETTEKVKLYAFSPEKETLLEDFYDVESKIDAVPLPEAIYNAYRATFRTLKLDKKPMVVITPTDDAESENNLFDNQDEE
jgi:adenine-specific DNA-methyltransferase